MTPDDILVVAPYNSQVALLGERLAPRGVSVGTVDRFQGQEAPVVIYSLATSSSEQAAGLADDLAAPASFRRWALNLVSPGLRQMVTRQIGHLLEQAGAPLLFSPEEGPEYFTPHGWSPVDVRSMLKWAAKKKRLGLFQHLISLLPEPKRPFGLPPLAWGVSPREARGLTSCSAGPP